MISIGHHLHLGKLVSRDLERSYMSKLDIFWEIFKIVDFKSLI